MDKYPAIKLLLRHGKALSIVLALAVPVFALWQAAWGVPSWGYVLAAVVAGGVLWFLLSVFVELVKVIAEMLLPA